MNLRQPPLSAELGTRGVMWLKTTLISHLYTGETFRQDKTKKNQQQDPPPPEQLIEEEMYKVNMGRLLQWNLS